MIFQNFQDLFFYDGTLKPFLTPDCSKTWSCCSLENYDYAHVWAGGLSLSEICPDSIYEEWDEINRKIKGFLKSFQMFNVNLNSYNPKQIIPENFLLKYLKCKNKICSYVFENFEKPVNYDFMSDLHEFCHDIEKKALKINLDPVKYTLKHKNEWKKLRRASHNVRYDAYKAVTGRLSTKHGSFPILNLKKDCRGIIEPYNDCFLELDFNAAELRTLLALSNKDQPDIDIHEWNAKHVFKEDLNRDEIKKKTFSWLYNPKAIDRDLEKYYNKELVLKKYYDGTHVNTIFERKIEADDHHALNYIVQSTTSDLFLKQAIKIWKLLKGKKTYVAFTIHDSLVLDFNLFDKGMVEGLLEEFSNTELGKFKVNISGGKNFGEMRKMNL